MKPALFFVLLIGFALVIAGCGGKKPASTAAPTPSAVPQNPNALSGVDVEGVRVVNLVARGNACEPNRIVVRKGETARILVSSVDLTGSFSIDALGITAKMAPGKTAHVEFTPGEWGDFTFKCTAGSGPANRELTGTLVIKP